MQEKFCRFFQALDRIYFYFLYIKRRKQIYVISLLISFFIAFNYLTAVSVSFRSLTKEIIPEVYRLCVCVMINKRSFECFMCFDSVALRLIFLFRTRVFLVLCANVQCVCIASTLLRVHRYHVRRYSIICLISGNIWSKCCVYICVFYL